MRLIYLLRIYQHCNKWETLLIICRKMLNPGLTLRKQWAAAAPHSEYTRLTKHMMHLPTKTNSSVFLIVQCPMFQFWNLNFGQILRVAHWCCTCCNTRDTTCWSALSNECCCWVWVGPGPKARRYPRCQSASFVLNVSSLCALLAGSEECAQGGSGLSGVEGAELPRAQALAVPGAEHPAHDGPGRAAHTEGRLAGKRGRGHQGRHPGQWRGQQLSSIGRTEWTSNKSTHTWDSFNHPFFC